MTLNAYVIGLNQTEPCGIHDIGARGMRDVLASWPVALLTTDIPFRDGLRFDVIVDGVASVTKRSGGPFEVIWRIHRRPPVASILDEIRAPDLMADVPLRRFREVIIPYFLEVSLLPFAAIYKCDVVFRKGDERIRSGEVWNDRIRVLLGITDNVRHPGLFPSVINLRVTGLAGGRTNVVRSPRRSCRSGWARRLGETQAHRQKK